MSLDLSKMQQKLNSLKNKGFGSQSTGSVKYWKPEEGENVVRIVPTADGDPFKEYWFHYGVGGSNFLCPSKNFGESCAVCDFVRSVYKDKTSSEEDRNQAKELSAKQRFYSPVVDRATEKEGVKVWAYSKKVYEALLGLVLNPDYGDITDPRDGIDLVVTNGKTDPKQKFAMSTVTPRRKSSALSADKDLMKQMLDHNLDFATMFQKKTSDEVQTILDKHFNGVEEGEDVERYGNDEESADLVESLKSFK